MKDSEYKKILVENAILKESIPWRCGPVDFWVGKYANKFGVEQDCLVLNGLRWLMRLKPTFMLSFPNISRLEKVGGEANGVMIGARVAQQMSYDIIEKGKCYVKSYFFGRDRPGRLLDLFQRLSESGYSLHEFEGLSLFPKTAVLEFTTKVGTRTAKLEGEPTRVHRVK